VSGQLYVLAALTPWKSATDTQCIGGQADPQIQPGYFEREKNFWPSLESNHHFSVIDS